MESKLIVLISLLLAGCSSKPHGPPPKRSIYQGLPVTGSVVDAQGLGFTDCVQRDAKSMRCRKHGVTLEGVGPYEAAVDLTGGDGGGGFDELILWHEADQSAVYEVTKSLEATGWKSCMTGTDEKGDQIIYTRDDVRFVISVDLSYWGKRRLRVIPELKHERRCYIREPLLS